MKYLAALVLSVALAHAADFYTGQAARLVLGQKTFTAQDSGATDQLLGAVGGIAVANDTLFVTDANRLGASPINHRVLVFRDLSQQLPQLRGEIAPDISRCPVCTGRADLILGQPGFDNKPDLSLSQAGLRAPLAVATDGKVLAIADTDNNRVLIWRSLPTVNGQPADIVVGQADFKSNTAARPPTAASLLGPQGVWIQNGRLMVADTANDRALIWNSIPTSNGQKADVVLGQPDFVTVPPQNLAQKPFDPKATTLLSPTGISSDGVRLYIADLGHNRVLIWNSIPATNQQPADLVIGQPDMTSAASNNSKALCEAKGKDDKGEDTFPDLCKATLAFPRFALSDGQRMFIADGGNDRVLVFSRVPTTSGAAADVILGQISDHLNQVSDGAEPLRRSSSDSLRTPLGLAWDGANLYVTDPFNRRVMVFSVGDTYLPVTAVRNSASREIYAVGSITLAGSIKEADELTVTIKGTDSSGSSVSHDYKYKVLKDDSFPKIIRTLVDEINADQGDPFVFASPNVALTMIALTSRQPGVAGNALEYSVKASDNALIQATTGGATLAGGQDAAKIAPGTLVTIVGEDLTDQTASAPADAEVLPKELGGVQVYFDGNRAPLLFVSPTQINTQVPFEVLDVTSISAYVRARRKDGRVTVTTPTGVPIILQNPGVFAEDGPDPRAAVALHYSSQATGTISVDGTAKTGDIGNIKIQDRTYSYTVKDGDTLESIRDGLIEQINQDPLVEAYPAGLFTRIRLRARVDGPAGNNIVYSGNAVEGAQVILTATTPALCCANIAGSRITEDNPALPGETIVLYAAGLECSGLIDEPTAANNVLQVQDGAIIDVGGGTTGIAVLEKGKVVYTADEPTGGTHFSLVIAGAMNITFEQAEELKKNPQEQPRLLPAVRPVMEKVGSIIRRHIAGRNVRHLYLVGGACAYPGMDRVVQEYTGIETVVPGSPLFVTPLGIAMHN